MSFVVFVFLLLIGLLAYLAQLNPGRVTIALTRNLVYDVSIPALVLFSMAFGGILVIVFAGIRGTKNLFLNWKYSRRQKREGKIEELYTEAVNAFLAKRYRDARAIFEKLLALEPNHVNSLQRLGKIHRLEQNYSEAIRLLRKARSLDEQNAEVLLSLSRALEEAERFEEGISHLKEILRTDSSHLAALTRLRDLLMRLARWEEAHEAQERLLKLTLSKEDQRNETESLLGLKYELGRQLMARGNRDTARRAFKGAIRLEKNFLPAYIGLGEICLVEGKPEAAAELWEKAFLATGNVILLHRLEEIYLSMGEPDRILRIYRDAVEHEPANPVFKFYLGKLYYRLEMIDDAEEVLAEIDAATEHFPDLQKILGNLALRRGDYLGAVEAFKKGLSLKKRVVVPYYCPLCDFHTAQWSGRCDRCGRWNTFVGQPILLDRGEKKPLSQSATLSAIRPREM